MKVKVLYPYVSDDDRGLTIREDDVIVDVQKVDDHWWEGVLDGKKGLFPITYVEVVDEGKYRGIVHSES